jgi:hypothetical protein
MWYGIFKLLHSGREYRYFGYVIRNSGHDSHDGLVVRG